MSVQVISGERQTSPGSLNGVGRPRILGDCERAPQKIHEEQ
jgi:hypothetical protein